MSNSYDPSDIVVIPGHATYLGQAMHAQGNMTERRVRVSDVKVLANSGNQIAVVKQLGWLITIPVILPFAALVPLLQAYSGTNYGRGIAPQVLPVTAIDLADNELTIADHGLVTTDKVFQAYDENAPTSIPAVTKRTGVFVSKVDDDTVKLHDTSLHATAGTDIQDFSAAQTAGAFWLTKERPLTVARATGVTRTYHNARPVEFPTLKLMGGELCWVGNLVFRAFPTFGSVPGDGNAAFWSESNTEYEHPAWDAAGALTLIADAPSWGAAPWDVLNSETGWEVMFKPTLAEFADGTWPVVNMKLTGFEVTVKGRPLSITRPQFEAVWAEQLGGQISRSRNFVLPVPGYTITVYGAALTNEADLVYSVTDNAIGDMQWTGLGTTATSRKPPFVIAAV